MLADASAEKLEEMVQESYALMNQELINLRNRLRSYGFLGDCNLSLTVDIKDKSFGTKEAAVKKRASHSFRRN